MRRSWLVVALVGGCTGFHSTTTPPRPRLVAPLSTSTVSVTRPTLRFSLPPSLSHPSIDLCTHRSCSGTRLNATVDAGGTSAVPDEDLSPGLWYWRVRAGGATSAVWQLLVQPTGGPATTWGSQLDLDGDGFADLAVGAPLATVGGQSSAGRVYVYRGGADGPDPTQPAVIEGPAGVSQFGAALAALDFDGDGFADLAVAALSGPSSSAGLVYVYRGGENGIQQPAAFVLGGAVDTPELGWSLDFAGDINGDGYADLLAGAPTAMQTSGNASGAGYVFFGGSSNNKDVNPLFPEDTDHESVGWAVAGGGDLDGDGLFDAIVGAPRAATSRGRVFVYFNRDAGLEGVPHTLDVSPAPLSQLGSALLMLGDVDGDGRADFATAAPNEGAGRVYRVSGGATPSVSGTVDGPDKVGANFGSTLAAADFDGDGLNDFAAGATCAPGDDPTCPGAVYLVIGGALTAFPAPSGVVSYGSALSTGDLDGDGHPDLTIGASENNGQLGRVDWYRNALPGAAPLVLNGSDEMGRFGFAVR
jgi:FG-GAP repeat